MNKFLLAIAMAFSFSATAATPVDWKGDFDRYRDSLKSATYLGLHAYRAGQASVAVGSCSLSTFIVGVTAAADTFPGVGNIAAEAIANMSNVDYKTYENLLEWERAADIGRGLLGGAIVGPAESLEFLLRLLAGRPNESFQALSKVYASTFATMDALFAEESLCVMSISKVGIITAEMKSRWHAPLKPIAPTAPKLP